MAKRRRQPKDRNHMGKIPSIQTPVTFEAGPGFVTAVIHVNNHSTLGLKFESPGQLFNFFTELMETAVFVWPNDPMIQYYLLDEEAEEQGSGDNAPPP